MRHKGFLALTGMAVALFAASAALGQNLIVNGGFESPVAQTTEGWNVFTSSQTAWTVVWNGGSETYESGGHTYYRPTDALLEIHRGTVADSGPYQGEQKVELDTDWTGPPSVANPTFNDEPANVAIYQNIPTVAGAPYELSFAWRGRPSYFNSCKMEVYWGGNLIGTYSEGSNNGWNTVTATVYGTGDDTELRFVEVGTADSFGTFLDDVVLEAQFESFDLCAGQDIPVGTVNVWNEGCDLYVQFQTEGWVMSETHLHVASTPDDFPHTKKGNPIPGKFDYQEDYEPFVNEDTYGPIDISGYGDLLYIAAHAVVLDAENYGSEVLTLHSAAGEVDVYGPLPAYAPLDGTWGDGEAAVSTWKHPSWPLIGGSDAVWISNTYYIEGPIAYDTWRLFHEEFMIPYTAFTIAGTVTATADNAEEVYLNGQLVGCDGEVQGAFVDDHEWNTVLDYLLDDSLKPGMNQLDFIVRNYGVAGGPESNPTGLIYEMSVEYDYYVYEETAWGDGCEGVSFPGNNWGTYFEFDVVGCGGQ